MKSITFCLKFELFLGPIWVKLFPNVSNFEVYRLVINCYNAISGAEVDL
jgi:hypothetical protein